MGGKLTLANLSKLPEDAVAVMKTVRTDGSILDTDPNEQWTEGSLPRGCVAALVGVGRKILSERLILSTAKDAETLRPYALVAAILVDRMSKARSRRLGIKACQALNCLLERPGPERTSAMSGTPRLPATLSLSATSATPPRFPSPPSLVTGLNSGKSRT